MPSEQRGPDYERAPANKNAMEGLEIQGKEIAQEERKHGSGKEIELSRHLRGTWHWTDRSPERQRGQSGVHPGTWTSMVRKVPDIPPPPGKFLGTSPNLSVPRFPHL